MKTKYCWTNILKLFWRHHHQIRHIENNYNDGGNDADDDHQQHHRHRCADVNSLELLEFGI